MRTWPTTSSSSRSCPRAARPTSTTWRSWRRSRSTAPTSSEPREIRINLSFPTEREAEAAGTELEEAGYEVVGFEATGEEEPWAIRAARDLRVDRENVTGFRSYFHDLAERHGGEFDAWEAAED